MLRRKLSSIFKQPLAKCLSSSPSPKIENDLSVEQPLGKLKENEILQHPDYFNVHNLFTVKDLFEAKVHYGHKITSLTRNMKPFVFGERLGHVIFDLDITACHLREALNFAAHIAYRDGLIIFMSRNSRMTLMVERTAIECKEFAMTREWRIGLFTNSEIIFESSIRLPDLCIFLNTQEENGHEHPAIIEAARMCIPVIGIVDSNCRPNLITYPVPGNDDSFSCFELYCRLFKEAILRGKTERQKDISKASKRESVPESSTETFTNETSNEGIKNDNELKTESNISNNEVVTDESESKTDPNVNKNVKDSVNTQ